MSNVIDIDESPYKPIGGPFSGTSQIAGTILGPDSRPKRRRVWLFAETSNSLEGTCYSNTTTLKSTYSDPETGVFSFQDLSPAYSYTTIAYDSAGEYDPVIKSGLKPEPME